MLILSAAGPQKHDVPSGRHFGEKEIPYGSLIL